MNPSLIPYALTMIIGVTLLVCGIAIILDYRDREGRDSD